MEDRESAVVVIEEAVQGGARLWVACRTVELSVRTYQRWKISREGDLRRGPCTPPPHKLTKEERQQVLSVANSEDYRDLPPCQIVPRLADKGKYIASESTFYRVLKEERLLAHRGKAQSRTHKRPEQLEARKPNQVWSWDITYMKLNIRGTFCYAYLMEDIYSRYLVAGDVFEEESADHSAALMEQACSNQGIKSGQLMLHSDNGGPMKGATMLATLQKLGVAASFSRPRVSDDNPYSEALFRTMKYRPEYPTKPFQSIEEAQKWVLWFVDWYNNQHLHSGINFVTPAQRHAGKDQVILKQRKHVYRRAREKNPRRWTTKTRNWSPVGKVTLNKLKNTRRAANQ